MHRSPTSRVYFRRQRAKVGTARCPPTFRRHAESTGLFPPLTTITHISFVVRSSPRICQPAVEPRRMRTITSGSGDCFFSLLFGIEEDKKQFSNRPFLDSLISRERERERERDEFIEKSSEKDLPFESNIRHCSAPEVKRFRRHLSLLGCPVASWRTCRLVGKWDTRELCWARRGANNAIKLIT